MQKLKFETKNPGSLGLPLWISLLMVSMFSMPILVLPMIPARELWKTPALLIVYPAAFFPLTVLYVLRRLMSRYALRVFMSGDADIVFPFNTVRIQSGNLKRVLIETRFVSEVNGSRTWIRFVDHADRVLASLSPNAFDGEVLEEFLAALKETNPSIEWSRT